MQHPACVLAMHLNVATHRQQQQLMRRYSQLQNHRGFSIIFRGFRMLLLIMILGYEVRQSMLGAHRKSYSTSKQDKIALRNIHSCI